ncbi:MAG: DUF218 domain-containing protein [Leptolyngbyaceae cyanobacterium SL_7_1]|nr:DUF218 domain-containing protein [Leptolyngbyaceae cyanobacterium SL_7_1]
MDKLYNLGIVDPSLCTDRAVKAWVSFTWGLSDYSEAPAFVIATVLTIAIAPLLFRQFPWRYRISGTGFTLLVLFILLSSRTFIGVSNRLLVSLIPSDRGGSADAIVVLGRGGELRQDRVNVASQLWEDGRAPRIFASGWGDAHAIADELKQRGVPESVIDGEPCSRTTEENALFTAALLQPQGVKRILLVTDAPHMLRSLLTFRSLGFEVVPHPNSLPKISKRQRGFLIYREYFGLLSYGVLGRFTPREAPKEAPIQTASAPKP